MARRWMFSGGLRTTTAGIEYTANDSNAPAIETSLGVGTNGTAIRISNATAREGIRQVHTSAQGDFYFRFYLYIVAPPTLTRVIGSFRAATEKVSIRLTSSGALQLYNSEDSAQVGSNSSNLSTGVRYRIELRCDSTTLASTAVDARIDGTSFASGTVDLAANPTTVHCGIDAGDATLDYIVSDLALNDTSGSSQTSWPGAESLVYLFPNGNGDNSDWGGSDGNNTDNYLLVNEIPPDTATYVQDDTSGQIDDYELSPTPAGVGATDTINVVQVGIYGAVSDATGADPDAVIRIKSASGGTVEESASLDFNSITFQGPAPLPADSNYKLTLYDLPGASTTPWSKATLDTAQIGVRESVTDTHLARVALIWLVAGHTPSAATKSLAVGERRRRMQSLLVR